MSRSSGARAWTGRWPFFERWAFAAGRDPVIWVAMKKIYAAATLPDAHLVRGLLAREGIDARVFNENAQSLMGEIPVHHAWPEIWIMDEDDEERARGLIRGMERAADAARSARCPHCGEDNPANFQVCWSCGRDF